MSQQINLFNPEFCRQETHYTLLTMLQALALILAGALCLYGYGAYQQSKLDAEAQTVAVRLAEAQSRMNTFSAGFSPGQANEQLSQQLTALEKTLAETEAFSASLGAGSSSNVSGYSDYMRAFARQIVPGLWLTGFSISGDPAQIKLSGGVSKSERVPDFISQLGREPVMQGKRFDSMQMTPDKAGKYLEFTLYTTLTDEVKP